MIEAVARTHPGRRRDVNEDACFADTRLGLFVVADGMGGHQAGEIASQLGVDALVDFVRQSQLDQSITWPYGLARDRSFQGNQLSNAMQLANQRIHHEARSRPDCLGMGAAIVAAVCRQGEMAYANVGDSRLYLLRRGHLEQLSIDQSWAESMLRAGVAPEVVRAHPMRHMLTCALGTDASLRVRIDDATLETGDLVLLSSDGLHGLVPDDAIAEILGRHSEPLDARANAFIEAANDAGGSDNVTVVLFEYTADQGEDGGGR